LFVRQLDEMRFAMLETVALLSAAMALQPADTTRASREAYTRCLRAFVERSLQTRMSPANFATEFPQQCQSQEVAYRAAVIQRETAARLSRADAEESATMEIEDARFNFRDRFDMNQPEPSAAPQAQPAAPETPAPTPASQPQ
jgi:hypothetical protein